MAVKLFEKQSSHWLIYLGPWPGTRKSTTIFSSSMHQSSSSSLAKEKTNGILAAQNMEFGGGSE